MYSLKLAATLAVLTLAKWVLSQGEQAEYIIDIADFFQDCDNGKPAPAINMDDLQTLQDDDGNSVMNGKMVFDGEYNDPVELNMYSTRLKQGSWVDGEISRDVPNACPLIMSSSEPWYVLTAAMKQQECPFKAGHSEQFDMLVMGDMGFENIPDSFAGDWRLYVEIKTQRDTEKVTECFRVAFSIVEK